MEAVDFKRKPEVKFTEIEEKVIAHMKLRAKAYVKDECGISWNLLKEKATGHASKLGIQEKDFKAPDGWLQGVLKRSSMTGIQLHGEAMELDEEQHLSIINEWKEEQFHPLIDNHNVPHSAFTMQIKLACFARSFQTAFVLRKQGTRTSRAQNR